MSETSPPKPSKLIVVERSRTAVILGLVAVLAYAVILLLAFGVIVARQGTIDTLRSQVDDSRDTMICRARFAADISKADAAADSAEHSLLVAVIEQLAVPIDERDFSTILTLANRVDDLNSQTEVHLEAFENYLEAESPLPCPID